MSCGSSISHCQVSLTKVKFIRCVTRKRGPFWCQPHVFPCHAIVVTVRGGRSVTSPLQASLVSSTHLPKQHPLGWMRVQNPTMSVSNLVWSCLLVSCWFLLVSLVTSYPHTSPCVLLKFTGFSRFYDRYQDWQGSNCLNSIGGQTIQKHDSFAFTVVLFSFYNIQQKKCVSLPMCASTHV
jgi:hypothetical protein